MWGEFELVQSAKLIFYSLSSELGIIRLTGLFSTCKLVWRSSEWQQSLPRQMDFFTVDKFFLSKNKNNNDFLVYNKKEIYKK